MYTQTQPGSFEPLENGADESEVALLDEVRCGSRRHGAHVHHVQVAPLGAMASSRDGEESNDEEERQPHGVSLFLVSENVRHCICGIYCSAVIYRRSNVNLQISGSVLLDQCRVNCGHCRRVQLR